MTAPEVTDPANPLFVEPTVKAEVIPAPKLFSDVVLRQWASPGSGPNPNGMDKCLYNMAPELSNILQVPPVDVPIVPLSLALGRPFGGKSTP